MEARNERRLFTRKRLPNLIGRLFRIPPAVPLGFRRVFITYQLSALMAIAYDLLFPPLFLAMGMPYLAAAKILSLLAWCLGLWLLRRGKVIPAVVIACLELFYHSLCGVVMLGWELGFQWYSLAVPINIALLPRGHRRVRALLLAASTLMIPALYLAWSQFPAWYPVEGWFRFFLLSSNWIILALVTAMNTAYYRIVAERLDSANLSALDKTEKLLLNILPRSIISELQGSYEDSAQRHQVVSDYRNTSVLFCDIVDFSKLSRSMNPRQLIAMLDDLFSRIDDLCDHFGLEKIKTIGDAYMLTAGCPTSMDDHAKLTIDCGFAILGLVGQLNAQKGYGLSLRIGIHSGPVIAGIIGKRKFSFDMWGDTVNIASRLESSGIPGRIHVSESTKALLGERFSFTSRGVMELKGQGPMQTWLVEPSEAPREREP